MAGRSGYKILLVALSVLFAVLCGGRLLEVRGQAGQFHVIVTKDREQSGVPEDQEDWPESLLPGEQINVNTAGAADLCRLPQIGQSRARAIVDWREEHGPFGSAEELTQVSGIGEGTLNAVRRYITVGDTQ